MITKTSLNNPAFCAKIKSAIIDAVREARNDPGGVALCDVFNTKHDVSLTIVASSANRQFKVLDREANDVTEVVKQALTKYHSKEAV